MNEREKRREEGRTEKQGRQTFRKGRREGARKTLNPEQALSRQHEP